MSREPSMEDILSSIRRVIARDEAQIQSRLSRIVPVSEVFGAAPEAQPQNAEPESFTDESGGHDAEPAATLVSSNAADATRQSLEALNAAFANAPAGTIPPQNAPRTLDEVVMEMLRPMLKQWLDTNLPPIVEAMVAKEIARITGRS